MLLDAITLLSSAPTMPGQLVPSGPASRMPVLLLDCVLDVLGRVLDLVAGLLGVRRSLIAAALVGHALVIGGVADEFLRLALELFALVLCAVHVTHMIGPRFCRFCGVS